MLNTFYYIMQLNLPKKISLLPIWYLMPKMLHWLVIFLLQLNRFLFVPQISAKPWQKNYSLPKEKQIAGSVLLGFALETISNLKYSVGGVMEFLECEDNEFLLNFYTRNHFKPFDMRTTVPVHDSEPHTLHQLLKFIYSCKKKRQPCDFHLRKLPLLFHFLLFSPVHCFSFLPPVPGAALRRFYLTFAQENQCTVQIQHSVSQASPSLFFISSEKTPTR